MLEQSPFRQTVDPRYLYLTPLLKTAVHKIRYVVERRAGMTAILGDIGLGKSSLLRYMLREFVGREDCRVAIIPTPLFKSDYAFMRGIAKEFGLPPRRSLTEQQEHLFDFVLQENTDGRNVLLLIDEAQKLDHKMLEVLRVLVNFETNEEKCLQVVVAGQLELKDRLSEKRNRAVKSRIFGPTLMSPLTLEETAEMIAFRCELAGAQNPFTDDAIEAIYRQTEGVPRDVVKACEMAWEMARLTGEAAIDAALMASAMPEARLE